MPRRSLCPERSPKLNSCSASLLLLFSLIAAFVVVDFVPLCVAVGGAVAVAVAVVFVPLLPLLPLLPLPPLLQIQVDWRQEQAMYYCVASYHFLLQTLCSFVVVVAAVAAVVSVVSVVCCLQCKSRNPKTHLLQQ